MSFVTVGFFAWMNARWPSHRRSPHRLWQQLRSKNGRVEVRSIQHSAFSKCIVTLICIVTLSEDLSPSRRAPMVGKSSQDRGSSAALDRFRDLAPLRMTATNEISYRAAGGYGPR